MTISSILISILLSLIFISPAFAASSGTGGLMRVGTPAASSSSSAGPAVVVMPEEGSGPDAVVAHPPPPPPPPPPEPAPAEPEVGSLSSEPITCEGASVISIIITPRLISDYTAQHALIQRYFDDYLNPIYNHEGIIKLCFDITNSNPEARDENFLEINRAIRFSPSSRYPIFISGLNLKAASGFRGDLLALVSGTSPILIANSEFLGTVDSSAVGIFIDRTNNVTIQTNQFSGLQSGVKISGSDILIGSPLYRRREKANSFSEISDKAIQVMSGGNIKSPINNFNNVNIALDLGIMSPSINILDEESKAVLVCETDPESGKIAIRKFEVKDGIVGQEIFLYGVDRDNNPTSYVAQCTVNRASECVVDAPIFGEDQDCTTGPYVRAILNARDSTSDFTEYLWLAKDPTLIGGAGGGIDLEGPAGVADSDEYGGSDFADTDGHTEITISDASGGDMSDVGYTEPPQDSGDESDEIGSQEVSGGEHLVSGVGGSSGSDLGGSEITAVAGTPIIGGASGKAGCSLIAEDDRYSLSTRYPALSTCHPALSTCHPALDAGSSLFILLLTILVVGRSIPAFSNSKQKVFNNKHR